jgi:hypothetical protein
MSKKYLLALRALKLIVDRVVGYLDFFTTVRAIDDNHISIGRHRLELQPYRQAHNQKYDHTKSH